MIPCFSFFVLRVVSQRPFPTSIFATTEPSLIFPLHGFEPRNTAFSNKERFCNYLILEVVIISLIAAPFEAFTLGLNIVNPIFVLSQGGAVSQLAVSRGVFIIHTQSTCRILHIMTLILFKG